MDCDQFDTRLHEQLDRRACPAADPDLSAHAERCPACAERLTAWSRVEAAIGSMMPAHDPIASDCDRADRGREAEVSLAFSDSRDFVSAGRRASRRGRFRQRRWAAAGLAAALLLVARVQVDWSQREVVGTPSAKVPAATGELGSRSELGLLASFDEDPEWLREVADRQWLDQTLPAVRSVRDGVAPLGRTLLQAMALLTSGQRVPGSGAGGEAVMGHGGSLAADGGRTAS